LIWRVWLIILTAAGPNRVVPNDPQDREAHRDSRQNGPPRPTAEWPTATHGRSVGLAAISRDSAPAYAGLTVRTSTPIL
jgi:hypothetical protein